VNDKGSRWQAGLALVVLAVTVVVADLGTAIVLIGTAAVMFYVAGLQKRYLVKAMGLLLLFAVLAVASKPYRTARVLAKIDPNFKIVDFIDPKGLIRHYIAGTNMSRDPNYQGRQSRIAIGSGGPFGVGLMHGRQKILFLPEAHTDFIYAVVGEETGLFGCTALLAGFLIILWRGFRLCWIAPDDFGRFLALGVTSSIVLQALIKMLVVVDLVRKLAVEHVGMPRNVDERERALGMTENPRIQEFKNSRMGRHARMLGFLDSWILGFLDSVLCPEPL
jgi:cell division protein FtsW